MGQTPLGTLSPSADYGFSDDFQELLPLWRLRWGAFIWLGVRRRGSGLRSGSEPGTRITHPCPSQE